MTSKFGWIHLTAELLMKMQGVKSPTKRKCVQKVRRGLAFIGGFMHHGAFQVESRKKIRLRNNALNVHHIVWCKKLAKQQREGGNIAGEIRHAGAMHKT